MSLRLAGKAGGHGGIKSAIDCTGNYEFNRVRTGIYRPRNISSRIGLTQKRSLVQIQYRPPLNSVTVPPQFSFVIINYKSAMTYPFPLFS